MILAVLNWNGAAFRIDVECREKGYSFKFWDENDKPGRHGRVRDVIRRMTYFNADFWDGGIFRKEFEYPSEEDDLHQFVATFNNKLAAVVAATR